MRPVLKRIEEIFDGGGALSPLRARITCAVLEHRWDRPYVIGNLFAGIGGCVVATDVHSFHAIPPIFMRFCRRCGRLDENFMNGAAA